ncbi:copper-binding protein [Paraoerskovia sediminicola]|uniref:Copper-binding protein n=1 Tax=Paraoerskovia sediminicola TaxID=1138587 RepID=A0ABM8G1Z5_9CELL|nr:CopD family protein [Paraoerskovia sediminicola]BDZ41994.1 copper-binding protein [Paraoerskovia sediminicola]
MTRTLAGHVGVRSVFVRSVFVRSVLLLAVAVGLVLGSAGSAAAHANLLSTDPAEGAVLETAPERVTFTFDESVIGVPAGIKVFDATGAEIASSASVDASRLFVDIDGEVPDGTLVVLWRLVSEDGHPIGGSLSFAVGAPSAVVDVSTTGADADTDAPLLLVAVRAIGYLGLLVAAGAAVFSVLFLPRDVGADTSRARLRPVVRVAAVVAVLAWWSAVPMIALYQLGLPASALTEWSTWTALAPAEYAVPAGVTLGLGLLVGALPARSAPGRARAALVLAGALVALAAPAFTGHTRATSPEALVMGVDVLHLVAGAVWLGGLVAIGTVLGELARGDLGGVVLARFSTCAAGALAVLVVAGSVLAWRIAGTWDALVDSGYGVVLLVKVLVALVAVAIAGWNRYSLLPRLGEASRSKDRRRVAALLLRSTRAEAGVLVAVLLVTGVLVDRSPEVDGAAGVASGAGVTEDVRLGDISAELTLEPLAVGPNTLTIAMVDDAGEPTEGYGAPG